jgi:hypothetical protein
LLEHCVVVSVELSAGLGGNHGVVVDREFVVLFLLAAE